MMNMNQKNIVTATAVLSVLMATAVMGLPSAFAGGDEEYTSSTETEAKNKQEVVSSGDGVSLGCQENDIRSQDFDLIEAECDNIQIDVGVLGNAQ